MTHYVLRFLIGGLLMVMVYFISNRSMSWAGILSAMPIFSSIMFLSNMFCKNASELQDQAKGGIVGMSIGFLFFLVLYISMYYIKSGVAFSISAISILCLVVLLLYVGQ